MFKKFEMSEEGYGAKHFHVNQVNITLFLYMVN